MGHVEPLFLSFPCKHGFCLLASDPVRRKVRMESLRERRSSVHRGLRVAAHVLYRRSKIARSISMAVSVFALGVQEDVSIWT